MPSLPPLVPRGMPSLPPLVPRGRYLADTGSERGTFMLMPDTGFQVNIADALELDLPCISRLDLQRLSVPL